MKWNKQADDGPLTIAWLGGRLIVVSCNNVRTGEACEAMT